MVDLNEVVGNLKEMNLERKDVLAVVANLLKDLEPGPLGDAFPHLAKHVGMIAYEGVALRKYQGILQVLLKKRDDDDPAYAGQWHCPGTIIRAKQGGGESETEARDRLLKREFGESVYVIRDINCGVVYNQREERGPCASMVHLLLLSGVQEMETLKWCPVNELPEVTVDIHCDAVIPLAVDYYLRNGWQ